MKYAFVALLCVVLLVGCGSPAAQESAQAPPTQNDEPTLREALEDAGVELDELTREMLINEEKRAKATYSVAYTVTMGAAGDEQTYSMSEFQDGSKRSRKDTTIPGLTEGRSFVFGERFVTCTKLSGSWRCEEFTASDDEVVESDETVAEVDTEWEEEELDAATVTRDGTESIAGVSAQCYKISMKDFVGRECRSAKGVVLLSEATTADGVFSMRATSYKESVTDADFALPAKAVEAGSPEANEASCRDACVYMELSDAECTEFCAQSAQYE